MNRLLLLLSALFVLLSGVMAAALFESQTHAYKVARLTGAHYWQVAAR